MGGELVLVMIDYDLVKDQCHSDKETRAYMARLRGCYIDSVESLNDYLCEDDDGNEDDDHLDGIVLERDTPAILRFLKRPETTVKKLIERILLRTRRSQPQDLLQIDL